MPSFDLSTENPRKARKAFLPNFTHSIDASIAALMASDIIMPKGAEIISIHDSFAVSHGVDVPEAMAECYRIFLRRRGLGDIDLPEQCGIISPSEVTRACVSF